MTITIGLLVLILVGLVLYWIGNAKLSEIGRIVFFCALLVFLMSTPHLATLKIGR